MTRYDRDDASDGQGGRHPLAGVPQEVLDASVLALTFAGEQRGNAVAGFESSMVYEADDLEPVAHSVLLSALDAWKRLGGLGEWAADGRTMPSQDENRTGSSLVELPDGEELVAVPPGEECTGDYDCAASVHVHGCFADVDGASCDDPGEHL